MRPVRLRPDPPRRTSAADLRGAPRRRTPARRRRGTGGAAGTGHDRGAAGRGRLRRVPGRGAGPPLAPRAPAAPPGVAPGPAWPPSRLTPLDDAEQVVVVTAPDDTTTWATL